MTKPKRFNRSALEELARDLGKARLDGQDREIFEFDGDSLASFARALTAAAFKDKAGDAKVLVSRAQVLSEGLRITYDLLLDVELYMEQKLPDDEDAISADDVPVSAEAGDIEPSKLFEYLSRNLDDLQRQADWLKAEIVKRTDLT